MIFRRCSKCVGSGKVMGGGMMIWDCEDCQGSGKLRFTEKEMEEKKVFTPDKNSPKYKKAIKKIKATDINITDDDADKIFSEELEKLKD